MPAAKLLGNTHAGGTKAAASGAMRVADSGVLPAALGARDATASSVSIHHPAVACSSSASLLGSSVGFAEPDEHQSRPPPFCQGDRCVVRGTHHGLVMFVGEVDALGSVVGVLLDEPVGNSNGRFLKRRYFDAPPKHGGFYNATEVAFEHPTERMRSQAFSTRTRRPPSAATSPARGKHGGQRSKQHITHPGARSPSRTKRAASATTRAGSTAGGSAPPASRSHRSRRAPSPTPTSTGAELPMARASQCTADGRGLHTAVVRQLAQFVITACDAAGRRCDSGGEPFDVLVRSMLPPQNLRCKVHDHGDGTYTAQYTPEVSGLVLVSVSLDGEQLPGSPFTVQAVTMRPDPVNCVLRGEALTSAIARRPMSFEVEFVDALGHVCCYLRPPPQLPRTRLMCSHLRTFAHGRLSSEPSCVWTHAGGVRRGARCACGTD